MARRLLTVGHGTLGADGFAAMLAAAGVRLVDGVLADAGNVVTAVMCAETLWWRCHRRLLADAAVLGRGADVRHLGHDGGLSPHVLTEGVRVDGGRLVYDVGSPTRLPGLP